MSLRRVWKQQRGIWWEEWVTAYSRLDGRRYKTSSQSQERTLQDPSQLDQAFLGYRSSR